MDQSREQYPVGRVAELAGVTVRTLHHYEHLGLLVPSARTGAGYRRYSAADLDRLRHVLFYRELGFTLDEIATLIDDPAVDTTAHLRRQRELLLQRTDRLTRMVAAVDKELEARTMGIDLSSEEKFEIFGPTYSEGYEQEAQERWGDTEMWRQSQARTSRFTKQDWIGIKEATDALNARLGQAVAAGVAPDTDAGMALAEEHRDSIAVFYDCPPAMHRNLGDMYVADERFARGYEEVTPGLTAWLRDAIHANADRLEAADRA
ncbi:MerR family transcriptional regulator [Nakamurella flavida]|uniref:MerR family transcriptional regulator n=1 Tax=Nakamurella flavida TaxID=363630 RepID=A0A938YIC8_9ACTN|nr:MerR family transcriptional regulator [Nakamurella flavida]MBM9475659.1 MerR family transcriptional regulator [Nakamurella flavida]MDP9778063.1 DNA-binding transcriptional MerR regulator [Nakamurella flavida]